MLRQWEELKEAMQWRERRGRVGECEVLPNREDLFFGCE